MKKSLAIRTPEGATVARLTWQDGRAAGQSLSPDLDADVARWVRDGLDEWVGEGVDATPRSTPSASPEFLDRLEAYLGRQFEEYVMERYEDDAPTRAHEPTFVEYCNTAAPSLPYLVTLTNTYARLAQVSALACEFPSSLENTYKLPHLFIDAAALEQVSNPFNLCPCFHCSRRGFRGRCQRPSDGWTGAGTRYGRTGPHA